MRTKYNKLYLVRIFIFICQRATIKLDKVIIASNVMKRVWIL